MWTYDIAREQSVNLGTLYPLANLSLEAGYNALGLYCEHRFASPCAPWAHGKGCLTPEMVSSLRAEFPSLRLIPFLNLLGHMEGFLYTERGHGYAEERFNGMQACPSNRRFVGFCQELVDDALSVFSDEVIHLGGDEAAQLGACPICKAQMDGEDHGKAKLYGEHFGPLCERVVAAGRRPAIWGDMLLEHPEVAAYLPKSTLIFDWQYFGGLSDSTPKLQAMGFEVVGCPSIQTYNAAWCHLRESEDNIVKVYEDCQQMGLPGICLTTWECGLFGAYDSIFELIEGSGKLFSGSYKGKAPLLDVHEEGSDNWHWSRLMGDNLAECGGIFAHSTRRSSLKSRLMLMANPFLLWLHHRDELCGEVGRNALRVLDEAESYATKEWQKDVCSFVRHGIEFTRIAEEAHTCYAEGSPEAAITKLSIARQIFDHLGQIARRASNRIGGSLADVERAAIAKEHVERVIVRVRKYGDANLGYLPSFEHLTHPNFVPHDQAAWWRINKWARD